MKVKVNHLYSHEWDEYENVEKIDTICKGMILNFKNGEKKEIDTEYCCVFIEKNDINKVKTKNKSPINQK